MKEEYSVRRYLKDMLQTENKLYNKVCQVYGLNNMITVLTCLKRHKGSLIDPTLVKNRQRLQKSINVLCGYNDWHHNEGCIILLKLHIPLDTIKSNI